MDRPPGDLPSKVGNDELEPCLLGVIASYVQLAAFMRNGVIIPLALHCRLRHLAAKKYLPQTNRLPDNRSDHPFLAGA